jgi:hypothetical protein
VASRPLEADALEREHLHQCPACAAEFARHCRLAEELALAAGDLRRVQAPDRVEARLVHAFRWQSRAGTNDRHGWLAPAIWWAAAAALVLCAGLFISGARQPVPQRHARPVTLPAVELAEWAAAPAESDADGNPAADASGFIPVPNADRFRSADEEVNLVRVEVPRSAMIAFGISVSAEDASESVEADVLLGPDGLARAVRFVD